MSETKQRVPVLLSAEDLNALKSLARRRKKPASKIIKEVLQPLLEEEKKIMRKENVGKALKSLETAQ